MKRWMFLAVLALAACDKAAAPLSELDTAARRTCINTIEARAISRNSVTYLDQPAAAVKKPNGQLEVGVKFSAKNEQGMASTLQARCVVSADGKTLAEIAVKDAR